VSATTTSISRYYPAICGQLESVNEEILVLIFERREMGLVVSTLSIIIKACCLLPLMQQKSALVCYLVTCRFKKKLVCIPHGDEGVTASPWQGLPRGDGVPGLYPSNAPRTRA